MKFDVANQEDEYPRMPMSRGALVEPSGEFKRIPHPTIKSASSKELPMENTISQSFEQATDKISPIKQTINTNLISVKTLGSFGILSGRSNQSKKMLMRPVHQHTGAQLP